MCVHLNLLNTIWQAVLAYVRLFGCSHVFIGRCWCAQKTTNVCRKCTQFPHTLTKNVPEGCRASLLPIQKQRIYAMALSPRPPTLPSPHTDEKDAAGLPLTCRAVFVIGKDKKLKLQVVNPITQTLNAVCKIGVGHGFGTVSSAVNHSIFRHF